MRSLRVAPYDQIPRVELNDLWHQYRLQLIILVLCLTAICLLSFYLFLSRKKARQSEEIFRSYFMEDSTVKTDCQRDRCLDPRRQQQSQRTSTVMITKFC